MRLKIHCRNAGLLLFLTFSLLGLSACVSNPLGPRLPETGTTNDLSAAPVRSREVERLLDGSFQTGEATHACVGERRLVIQDGRMELVETLPMTSTDGAHCVGSRGQVIYRGTFTVGDLLVKDAVSRPMTIVVDEVEVMALTRSFGMSAAEKKLDPCDLSGLAMGDRELLTGRDCGAFGQFPRQGEVIQSEIVINSGQRIQLKNFPGTFDETSTKPVRGIAGRHDVQSVDEGLKFERTSL